VIAATDRAERLLALHLHEAVRRWGSAALSVVDLPPLSEGPLVPAQIRVGAVLAFCRHVEEAGLLLVVEHLARRFREGAWAPLDPSTSEALFAFGRDRNERFTAEEREARYRATFDPSYQEAFEHLTAALETLARDPYGANAAHRVGIGVAGEEVARLVSNRCAGIAAFFAREVLGEIRRAWSLVRGRELQAAVGAVDGWDVLRRVGPELGQRLLPPERAVPLAESSRTVLGWLADEATALSTGGVEPPPAVLEAATTWRLHRRP
jgi:hypothetical protein